MDKNVIKWEKNGKKYHRGRHKEMKRICREREKKGKNVDSKDNKKKCFNWVEKVLLCLVFLFGCQGTQGIRKVILATHTQLCSVRKKGDGLLKEVVELSWKGLVLPCVPVCFPRYITHYKGYPCNTHTTHTVVLRKKGMRCATKRSV